MLYPKRLQWLHFFLFLLLLFLVFRGALLVFTNLRSRILEPLLVPIKPASSFSNLSVNFSISIMKSRYKAVLLVTAFTSSKNCIRSQHIQIKRLGLKLPTINWTKAINFNFLSLYFADKISGNVINMFIVTPSTPKL